MLRTINDIVSAGLNSLVPPTDIQNRDLTINDVGTGLTFAAPLSFLNVKNDSKKNSIWVRFGSLTASTNSIEAARLGPQDALELHNWQIPEAIDRFVIVTAPTKTAEVRVLVGVG